MLIGLLFFVVVVSVILFLSQTEMTPKQFGVLMVMLGLWGVSAFGQVYAHQTFGSYPIAWHYANWGIVFFAAAYTAVATRANKRRARGLPAF